MNWAQFFAMGGYAAYVWPAYGVSVVGLVGATVWTLVSWRRTRAALALLESLRADKR